MTLRIHAVRSHEHPSPDRPSAGLVPCLVLMTLHLTLCCGRVPIQAADMSLSLSCRTDQNYRALARRRRGLRAS